MFYNALYLKRNKMETEKNRSLWRLAKDIIRFDVDFHSKFHQLGIQDEKGFALNYC